MSSFPYRLAAIDLDETLLGSDKHISEENSAAVRSLIDRGVQVVLASGRRYENMIRYATRLSLEGPIITCQDAVAMQIGTREPLYQRCLDPAHAHRVIEAGLARSLTVIVYQMEATYASRRDYLTDLYDRRSGDSLVVVRPLGELRGPIMKVLWLAEPDAIPDHAAWAAIHLAEVQSVPTDPEYLELMDSGANKGAALEAVAAELGIDREQVIAFGDGNNDAPMLQWAGLGIAMHHGTAAAHASADRIGPAGAPETALAQSIRSLFPRI